MYCRLPGPARRAQRESNYAWCSSYYLWWIIQASRIVVSHGNGRRRCRYQTLWTETQDRWESRVLSLDTRMQRSRACSGVMDWDGHRMKRRFVWWARTKVLLAKLLLKEKPDILRHDEPTNYLDAGSILTGLRALSAGYENAYINNSVFHSLTMK